MYAHASGERIVRIVDRGAARGNRGGSPRTVALEFERVDYCQDCEIGGEYQRRMQAEGRCILPAGMPAATAGATMEAPC